MTAVTARAPAKVNLQLAVGPARAHGYHDVVTVYHAVSLFDEVTVFPAERDSVVITGEGADSVPADDTNLAARAVAALLRSVGPGAKDSPGLAIRISKRIPVAVPGRGAPTPRPPGRRNEGGAPTRQAELSELAAYRQRRRLRLVGGTAIEWAGGGSPRAGRRDVSLGARLAPAGCPCSGLRRLRPHPRREGRDWRSRGKHRAARGAAGQQRAWGGGKRELGGCGRGDAAGSRAGRPGRPPGAPAPRHQARPPWTTG